MSDKVNDRAKLVSLLESKALREHFDEADTTHEDRRDLFAQAAARIRELEAEIARTRNDMQAFDWLPDQTAEENWLGLVKIDGAYWRLNGWGRTDWQVHPLVRVPDDHARRLLATMAAGDEDTLALIKAAKKLPIDFNGQRLVPGDRVSQDADGPWGTVSMLVVDENGEPLDYDNWTDWSKA